MESRNITTTTRGELPTHSPQDRKAVNTLEELLEQVGEKTSTCFVAYPLTNLIPEIIADDNMEHSFKRVMSNLHNADTRNGLRWREKIKIDGVECTPRMVRYMKRKYNFI